MDEDEAEQLEPERRSPILLHDGTNLYCSNPQSSSSTPKSNYNKHKDAYAIETISSPELVLQSVPVSQPSRKARIPAAKSKVSNSKKLLTSATTPLSGLVSKKSVCRASKVLRDIDKDDDCTVKGDESSREVPTIETFDSPEKPSVSLLRHRESFTPNMAFHGKLSFGSTPLSRQSKKLSSSNRTLDASIIESMAEETNIDRAAKSLNITSKPTRTFESPSEFLQQKLKNNLVEGLSLKLSSDDNEISHPECEMHCMEIEDVVENAKEQEVEKNDTCGFLTCMSLVSEQESLVNKSREVATDDISVKIDVPEEDDSVRPMDLEFALVSNDSVSDDTDEEFAVPIIDDPHDEHSPKANVTKKDIQSYETPTKVRTAFSEALNIGEFGSPESESTELEDEEEHVSKVKVTTSVEDEFVDESEPIRLNKRKRKGSLMEKVSAVISRAEASNSLFDYEVKSGLRQNKGKFVSNPLVVCRLWKGDEGWRFILCKPLKYCKAALKDVRGSLIACIVHKVDELSVGDVILAHFPVVIAYNSAQKIPYVFLVGNQLSMHDQELRVTESQFLNIDIGLESQLTNPYLFNPVCSVKHFQSNILTKVSEAALCQNLVEEVVLTVNVLHVVRIHNATSPLKVAVFCFDDDSQPCWVNLTTEHDMKRAAALETLHILADGAKIQIKGFIVSERYLMDKKTRNFASYCSNSTVQHDSIFVLTPVDTGWIISSSGGIRVLKKQPTLIKDILSSNIRGKRYLIDVKSLEFDGQNIFLRDCSDTRIQYIQGEHSYKTQFDNSSVPFSLDAVYYYNGKLFSDEFTKLV